MSKREIAVANKRRGRAFQTKLAQLARGVNIGTLGGEDISHEEFSYEAKTYNPNNKTNKGKPWTGDLLVSTYDKGYARKRLSVVVVKSFEFSSLVLLRWYWWSKMVVKAEKFTKRQLEFAYEFAKMRTFIGNTYMNQAEANCPDAKVPVVVVHTTGRRHEQDVVLLRFVYWESLLNKILDKTN